MPESMPKLSSWVLRKKVEVGVKSTQKMSKLSSDLSFLKNRVFNVILRILEKIVYFDYLKFFLIFLIKKMTSSISYISTTY